MPDDFSQMTGGPRQRTRGCTAKEAAIWLTRTDEGRQWADQHRSTKSMAQLVHEAVEASRLAAAEANAAAERREATDKRKARTMSSTTTIIKNARALGEHGMTRLITDYAKRLHPELTSAQAFVKVFTADDSEGRALRTIHAISKGMVTADSPEREYGLGRSVGVRSGALDEDEYDDADAEITDDANDEAMALLERLADKLRQRSPGMTKAQAFTKVYTDPQYAPLAKRERMQSMRKIGMVA